MARPDTPASPPTPPEDGAGLPPGAPGAGGGAPPEPERRLRIDRRGVERRQRNVPVPVDRRAGAERRHGERRGPRNINAYDLGVDELEFINAISTFKQRSGRAFPTWSDVLRIVRELGYQKTR